MNDIGLDSLSAPFVRLNLTDEGVEEVVKVKQLLERRITATGEESLEKNNTDGH